MGSQRQISPDEPNRKGMLRAEWIVGLRQYIIDTVARLGNVVTVVANPPVSGVDPGTYTAREVEFTVNGYGQVTSVGPAQCTSWLYEATETASSLVLPAAGGSVASNTVGLVFGTATLCNPAFDGATGHLASAPQQVASVQVYFRATPPGGWAAVEVIMDLYHWNDAGTSWVLVAELDRQYVSATPIPPTISLGGAITFQTDGDEDDYYMVRLRQTGATPQTITAWHCRWSGSFIDAGECEACTG